MSVALNRPQACRPDTTGSQKNSTPRRSPVPSGPRQPRPGRPSRPGFFCARRSERGQSPSADIGRRAGRVRSRRGQPDRGRPLGRRVSL